MDRRGFLKIAFGAAASAAVATAAQAALLAPRPLHDLPPDGEPAPQPAVAGDADVEGAKVEQVRWHGRRGWHRHRRWGWHRPRWHRRHWGWRRRRHYWGWHRHRRVYRRRYWRRRYW